MKKTGSFAGLILFLMNSVPALAQSSTHPISDAYFESKTTTKLISVEERMISDEEIAAEESPMEASFTSLPSFLQEGVNPMAIADVAFKVWDIIKDGKPVVNVQYKNVSALPNIANDRWESLVGWKPERILTYGVKAENTFGMTTVDLEYKVRLRFGGGLKGKGQYIASARVIPTKADVMWGYNLDASAEVGSVFNKGTEEDPIAAIDFDVSYKISTLVRSSSGFNNYKVSGDGMMIADDKVIYTASSR